MTFLDDLLAQARAKQQSRMGIIQSLLTSSTAPTPTLSSIASGAVSSGGVPSGFTASGENPWGIDPNGMDLVSRHGVTLDDDAMQSLLAARRAGYNPFPYIGGGYRSIADSNALYAQRHDANGNLLPGVLPAAPGGSSMHNYGLAFDAGSLPEAIRNWLLQNGWFWGNSFNDPPHMSYGRLG